MGEWNKPGRDRARGKAEGEGRKGKGRGGKGVRGPERERWVEI